MTEKNKIIIRELAEATEANFEEMKTALDTLGFVIKGEYVSGCFQGKDALAAVMYLQELAGQVRESSGTLPGLDEIATGLSKNLQQKAANTSIANGKLAPALALPSGSETAARDASLASSTGSGELSSEIDEQYKKLIEATELSSDESLFSEEDGGFFTETQREELQQQFQTNEEVVAPLIAALGLMHLQEKVAATNPRSHPLTAGIFQKRDRQRALMQIASLTNGVKGGAPLSLKRTSEVTALPKASNQSE